jgi:hypothetical protein
MTAHGLLEILPLVGHILVNCFIEWNTVEQKDKIDKQNIKPIYCKIINKP